MLFFPLANSPGCFLFFRLLISILKKIFRLQHKINYNTILSCCKKISFGFRTAELKYALHLNYPVKIFLALFMEISLFYERNSLLMIMSDHSGIQTDQGATNETNEIYYSSFNSYDTNNFSTELT